MDMVIVYWIAAAIGLIYAIVMLLAVLKISNTLEDIAAANREVKEFRAKKHVAEVLKQGHIHDPRKTNEAENTLSATKDDTEVRELVRRLEELKKQNE